MKVPRQKVVIPVTPRTPSRQGQEYQRSTGKKNTAPPSGVRNDLVPLKLIFGNMWINLLIALISHVVIAMVLFGIFSPFIPNTLLRVLGALASVSISLGLYYWWSREIPVGSAATVYLFGKLSNAWLTEGTWWAPFGIFSFQEHNTKEDIVAIESFKSVSAKVIERNGDISEQLPLVFGVSKIYWAPSGPQFALVNPTAIKEGFDTYVLGELRKQAREKSWRSLLSSGSVFENLTLTSPDIKSMCERWGITVYKINIGEIDFSPEFKQALERAAIEREECTAEDIEIAHVSSMITIIARSLKDAGMDPRETAEKAAIIYQNQVEKALGINFMGAGNSSIGDFTRAAVIPIAEGRRSPKK